MRIVRPGMVVGPQQQYMQRNQMKWVAWVRDNGILQYPKTLLISGRKGRGDTRNAKLESHSTRGAHQPACDAACGT